MSSSHLFSTRLDEIVFAGRNKNYGAYILRSTYAFNLLKSLLFPLAILCFCTFVFYLKEKSAITPAYIPKIKTEQSPVRIVEMDLNKKHNGPQKEDIKKEPESGKSAGSSLVVKDETELKKDSVQTILNQTTDQIRLSDENKTEMNNKDSGNPGSKGKGTLAVTEPVLVPDEMPEFEGGLSALYAFISRQIHYPNEAREAMKQGKISVRFIVDENGRVILPRAMNRLGFGLDAEAERVVGILPAFKSPAKIGGNAVKCFYVLPINFKLN